MNRETFANAAAWTSALALLGFFFWVLTGDDPEELRPQNRVVHSATSTGRARTGERAPTRSARVLGDTITE